MYSASNQEAEKEWGERPIVAGASSVLQAPPPQCRTASKSRPQAPPVPKMVNPIVLGNQGAEICSGTLTIAEAKEALKQLQQQKQAAKAETQASSTSPHFKADERGTTARTDSGSDLGRAAYPGEWSGRRVERGSTA